MRALKLRGFCFSYATMERVRKDASVVLVFRRDFVNSKRAAAAAVADLPDDYGARCNNLTSSDFSQPRCRFFSSPTKTTFGTWQWLSRQLPMCSIFFFFFFFFFFPAAVIHFVINCIETLFVVSLSLGPLLQSSSEGSIDRARLLSLSVLPPIHTQQQQQHKEMSIDAGDG